jgi:DNA-directed RNA polymerase specialized sigma24 family protein
MEHRNLNWSERTETLQVDKLLASRYSRLVQWATVLTRGDKSKADDVVQEFCLYISLVKPDLSDVANLDGYFYICLRHIYLSSLTRASREALQLVSIEDFDSFAFAVSANFAGDPLQRQNDLRRICSYAVWRKESAKSASYFILHFFHGYGRREIAELARLPISAIYNKLKTARSEVRSHLEEPDKLRVIDRAAPPVPALSWSLLSSGDLFKELRQTILEACHSECLPVEELLAHYRSSTPTPIPCPLLAHIVSCERCLSVIDHDAKRPTLKDREPLDVFGFSSETGCETPSAPVVSFEGTMHSVHRKWARIHEHRPDNLSIALNGVVIANHDVRSEHNRLSARIEHAEKAQFIEVFSEQHLRLALLAVGEPPPQGLAVRTQRVALSDGRWLELSIRFDGLGLYSEVTYLDPALASVGLEEDAEELPLVSSQQTRVRRRWSDFLSAPRANHARFVRPLRAMTPHPSFGWGLAIATLISSAGYLAYHRASSPMDAAGVLNKAIATQSAMLQGETEHQVVHIEESASDGVVLQQGTVDLWKDGDGSRYVRRLYDAQRRLVAAEWKNREGKAGSRREGQGRGVPDTEHSSIDSLWDQDLSAKSFAALEDGEPRVRVLDGGYELTRIGPSAAYPQLISATLMLDRRLQPVSQVLRVRSGEGIHEVRFVQAAYERKPASTVPDSVFDPESDLLPLHGKDRRSFSDRPHNLIGSDARLAELEIAVLYQLHSLGADTGIPIEVLRTPDGRIRVSGTVADEELKQAIDHRLRDLAGNQLLDLRLVSSREIKLPFSGSNRSTPVDAYEVTQPGFAGDVRIRSYFQARGLTGQSLDAAVARFSKDALQHAQLALQHAYAVDRLGSSLSAEEMRAISLNAQKEWAEMVNGHATELAAELRTLHDQLAEISSVTAGPSAPKTEGMAIDDPTQFAKRSGLLLSQVRELNGQVGEFFTSSGRAASQENLNASLQTIMDTIPLRQAEEVAAFAARLGNSADGKKVATQTR